MEGNSANFTFDNHPVIATLRMKGVVKPKSWSGEHSDSSEQEKYSETQLHQIFNKLELSSSMVGAFNGIPYFRHFDAPHLQKLITVNVSFPPEIIQTIPYYILHAAVSFCFDLEESYSSSNLVLVLRSLIFLCCRSQLATAENMFYFLLKFSSVNALSLETRPILDLVENLIKIKNRADPRLISALIFWASNTRSNGLIPSKSEEKIKTTGAFLQRFSSLDEDTKLVLSYTDELLKRYTDCITPDDASLLFARIEKPIRSLEPFGISMFCTIFKHLPNELLINFYKQIPQNIVDFMNREIPVTRYKRVDEKTLKEAEKVDVNKVPQIIHAFRKKLYFNYDVSYPEYKPYPAKTDPILETYNILVCSKSRELITSSLMKTFDVYGEKKRFYDFISCFLQLSDNCPYVVPFFQKLFDTDVFDPRITIFEEQTEETKKMLELRTLAFDKIAENKYICLSERISRFVPYPNISAEIFMRLTHTHYVNSQHYLDFPQIGLDYIPSYQEVHVSLNTKLDEASDEEKEAIKQKIKIVERCRLAMIEFFVETMSICECFEVYTQNDEFLSLFFSLSYEKQISDIVLDSVFAHFENPSDEFLKQIPDILAVLTTPHGDFTENNIALTTSILKRL